MNTILIEKTTGGFVVRYAIGLRVKIAHHEMLARNEADLVDVLKGEGVSETAIKEALERLREDGRSTAIDFPSQS